MNLSLIIPELAVIGLALAVLLIDLWTPPAGKRCLGCVAAVGLAVILLSTFGSSASGLPQIAFSGQLVRDDMSVFFNRFFLAAALLVVMIGIGYGERLAAGIGEFYVLTLLALAGMMFAASANDFIMAFVSLEVITVTFYVLVSFQRGRLPSLEAGVKYLVIGALSTAFLVFGIALVFAASNTTNFAVLNAASATLVNNRLLWLGLLMVLIGLAFKISAFPMQMWTPDVYQGAPTPVTAFLAIASKGAGFVLLIRVFFAAVPYISRHWETLFMFVAGITILYGNLCAIPQRSLKRLLGYSSISHAGYLMLGIAALNHEGIRAVLYYLLGYLFTLGAAFIVIILVCKESDDIASLAGLNQRSPILAAAMAMAMVSLAGVPPLAGFAGKLLLLLALVQHAAINPSYYVLALVTIAGVVISFYYYFGVIRAIYWPQDQVAGSAVAVSATMKISVAICMVGMLYLGLFPNAAIQAAADAANALKF